MDIRTDILLTYLKKHYSEEKVSSIFETYYRDVGPEEEVDYILKNPGDKEAVFAYLNARSEEFRKNSFFLS